jgi:hypothetical protein
MTEEDIAEKETPARLHKLGELQGNEDAEEVGARDGGRSGIGGCHVYLLHCKQ